MLWGCCRREGERRASFHSPHFPVTGLAHPLSPCNANPAVSRRTDGTSNHTSASQRRVCATERLLCEKKGSSSSFWGGRGRFSLGGGGIGKARAKTNTAFQKHSELCAEIFLNTNALDFCSPQIVVFLASLRARETVRAASYSTKHRTRKPFQVSNRQAYAEIWEGQLFCIQCGGEVGGGRLPFGMRTARCKVASLSHASAPAFHQASLVRTKQL